MESAYTVLEVSHLSKSFGSFQALKNVSFNLQRGEIFGFIGPNGAGKSTTIRVLLGILKKSGGSAKIFGMEVFDNSQAINERVAYVPGDVYLWPNLSGGELIDYLLKLRGSSRSKETERLIALFELDPTKKARTYSKGNRQKVAIIAALAADADLYIFDEPTSGLDPLNEFRFQAEVKKLKNKGKSILLSSHILSEVEKLADRVGIIREGEIIEQGSLDALKQFTTTNVVLEMNTAFEQLKGLPTLANFKQITPTKVSFSIDNQQLKKLLELLSSYEVTNIEITRPKLEEVFMKYYGDREEGSA